MDTIIKKLKMGWFILGAFYMFLYGHIKYVLGLFSIGSIITVLSFFCC
jgi:hypothetical protein